MARYLDALHRLVDASGLNSDQATEVKNILTLEHGTDEEKAAVRAGDPVEQAKAAAKAAFDAAVAKRVQELQAEAAANAEAQRQAAAIQAAAQAQAGQG